MRLTASLVTHTSDLRNVEGAGTARYERQIDPKVYKIAIAGIAFGTASTVKILTIADVAASDLASPTTT